MGAGGGGRMFQVITIRKFHRLRTEIRHATLIYIPFVAILGFKQTRVYF